MAVGNGHQVISNCTNITKDDWEKLERKKKNQGTYFVKKLRLLMHACVWFWNFENVWWWNNYWVHFKRCDITSEFFTLGPCLVFCILLYLMYYIVLYCIVLDCIILN